MCVKKILAMGLVLIWLPLAAWCREVSLVMVNNDLIKGELIGMDSTGLYLKDKTLKSRFYPARTIAKVFDSKTQEDLTGQLGKPAPTADDGTESPAPADTPGVEATPAPQPETTVIEEEGFGFGPFWFRHHHRRRLLVETGVGSPDPGPGPFHRGFNLGVGFSTGGHTPNNEIQQYWLDSVDPSLGGYDVPSPTSLDLDLMYRVTPRFEAGAFGQYYVDGLGNQATVSNVTYVPRWYGYDTTVANTNYDFLFNAYSYGLKVRLRAKPNSRVALALYGGRLQLASGAGLTASDDYGTWYSESYGGSAPYYRADLELTLMRHYRGALLLQLGYQWAHIRNATYTVTGGGSGSGPLSSYSDGSPVDIDFSGVRAGLNLVLHL